MQELKPCPFCGKKELTQSHDKRYGYTTLCTWCGGRMSTHLSREESMKRWNQREDERQDNEHVSEN